MAQIVRTGILHCPTLDERAGEVLRRALTSLVGREVRFVFLHESYVADARNWIEATLCRWCDEEELDLVLTVGGTLPAPGPGARQMMSAATTAVLERTLPGLGEAMRAHAGEFSELALLDCGVVGIRGRTLVINLPGGAGPAWYFLEAVVHLIGPILAHLHERPDAPQLRAELDLPDAYADAEDEVAAGAEEASGGEVSEEAPDAGESRSGLDADEFADFLKRRRK